MSKDYYNILGVNKNATKEEIKRAYRKLAHEHHPDKNGGDDKKFKEINEAYQILSNDQRRQQYDRFGSNFSSFGGQGNFNFEDFFGGFSSQRQSNSNWQGQRVNLEDLFSDLFGGAFSMGGFSRRPRNRNISVNMDVDLESFIQGAERNIRLDDLNIKFKIKPKLSRKESKEIKKIIKNIKRK